MPAEGSDLCRGSHGDRPLSYQWWHDDQQLAEATSATLTLANVQMADGGQYRVEVSNAYGTATSEAATLTVEAVSGCTVPPAGLVGWWRGEDNAADALGDNTGELVGGAA